MTESITEAEVERLLFPPVPSSGSVLRPQPGWAVVHQELRRKRAHVFDVGVVLDRDRLAVEVMRSRIGPRILHESPGVFPCAHDAQRRQRVELRIGRFDSRGCGIDEFVRRHFAAPEQAHRLARGQAAQFIHAARSATQARAPAA